MTYYCEICKIKVNLDAESCPQCGVFFSGVMCPRCEKIGSNHEFLDGCPQCGNPDKGSFVGKVTSQATIPKGNQKHRPWPSSLYWFLSVLIVVIVGFIASYWLKN